MVSPHPPMQGLLAVSLANVSQFLSLEPVSRILAFVRVFALPQNAPHETTTVWAPPDTLLPW